MKILVAMSGGVDSTVTAYMLKNAGHEIEGCYMRLHDDEASHKQNLEKIEKVTNFLGIKYHVLDIREQFKEKVYDPFVQTYKDGLTPNPCVVCNRKIKFGALIAFAKELGVDKLATGHYVRVVDGFITKAKDLTKDQSYFLSNVSKDALDFVIFPLGDMLKSEVKEFASTIPVLEEFATQKESSEICFVEDTYIEILKEHMNVDMPGNVVNTKGEVVGKHRGYMHYTIGKRRGFEVRGAHDPHYVVAINAAKNEIVVGTKEDLSVKTFDIKDINMFIDEQEFDAEVKIRYRTPQSPCHVSLEGTNGKVTLVEDVQGLAAGQMAVFYIGDKVVGGGWIQ